MSGRRDEPRVGVLSEQQLFQRRTARVLTVVVSLTLALTLGYALLRQPGDVGERHAANSFSVSAIGFAGLIELLAAGGVPAMASEHVSGQRASPSRPLLLLSPPLAQELGELAQMLDYAAHRQAPVIVVLPKWQGTASLSNRDWVARLSLLASEVPESVLRICLHEEIEPGALRLGCGPDGGAWSARLAMNAPPSLADPQLLAPGAAGLQPLIWCAGGVLAALHQERQVLIISDPDLLNNSGLAVDGNAALAVQLLVETFPDTSALVVDETLHGFSRAPSLWRELLRFPLVMASMQLLLLLAAVVWAGFDRFGSAQEVSPRVAAGTRTLIDTTTSLIARGASVSYTLLAYWELVIRHAARRLGITPGPGSEPPALRQARRLAAAGAGRRTGQDLGWLTEQVQQLSGSRCEPRRAVRLARHLWRWRKEMLDGAS